MPQPPLPRSHSGERSPCCLSGTPQVEQAPPVATRLSVAHSGDSADKVGGRLLTWPTDRVLQGPLGCLQGPPGCPHGADYLCSHASGATLLTRC